ncbi:HlyD family secretion protein [Psychromonas sp.]|uniref:HlyD family secretion protein n=1 Tax=Psychromonas sp. TaxID=1884585 RepID=UPI003A97ED6C
MKLAKLIKALSIVIVVIVIVTTVIHLNQPESAAANQSTDDAYVQADFTVVAPQVAATVEKVMVEEHQTVKKGDLLISMDKGDFIVAVNSAKAQVASAQASIEILQATLIQQASLVAEAEAELDANKAQLVLAERNFKRYSNLASDGSGTVQDLQQAESQFYIQKASLGKNQAALIASKQKIAILKAQIERAKATLLQAESMLDAANLKLSYTEIKAPIDGVVGKKSARVGNYVNPGNPLLVVVPLDKVYVHANYRETQLAKVKVGQSVELAVDALPGKEFTGHVASIAPASGVSYSSVSAHNATGNFTKIVQRIAVRIEIDNAQKQENQLRVGMSVVPTIITDE